MSGSIERDPMSSWKLPPPKRFSYPVGNPPVNTRRSERWRPVSMAMKRRRIARAETEKKSGMYGAVGALMVIATASLIWMAAKK